PRRHRPLTYSATPKSSRSTRTPSVSRVSRSVTTAACGCWPRSWRTGTSRWRSSTRPVRARRSPPRRARSVSAARQATRCATCGRIRPRTRPERPGQRASPRTAQSCSAYIRPPRSKGPIMFSRKGTWLAAAAVAAATALTGLAAHGAAAAAPVSFYVSPTGSDGNSGTSASSPFGTLAHAQSAVRAALAAGSGPVTVNLAGGDYRLSSSLTFTSADSGSSGADVTWQAESGASPVVSGGVQVTGWQQTDSTKNIWSAPVASALSTRQLYINGTRVPRASGSLPVSVKQTSTGYTTSSGDPMAKWRNPSAIEFVYRGGLGAWTEPRCPVSSISSTTITMAEPCWNNSTQRVMRTDGSGRTYELVGRKSITESPTAVENAYELLTAGHWYLDPSAHRIYYIPRSGETIGSEDVEAAALPTLISAVGTASAPVHNLVFRGIQFSY